MLSMTEKALVGLALTVGVAFAATLILPVWTYKATLSTSPSSSNNISVPLGRPFNVTCIGDSNLNGNFKNMKWLNPKGEAISNVKQVEKNRLLLKIDDPKEADSGVYKCLATYDDQNMEIHVSVNFHGPRPEFESTYEVVQAEEGHRVELSCQATGEEPLTYEWFDKNEDKMGFNVSSVHISTSTNGSILIIEDVLSEHEGVYMCTCSNKHGMSNKLYELKVSSSDGNDTALIRNVKTTKITDTSVQFSISTSESVIGVIVRFIEYVKQTPKVVTFLKGEVYEINGLIPGGLYTFQFRPVTASYNVSGDWPNTLDVTLLPSKPDVILRNLEGDTLKIQWIKKSDDSRRRTTDKYQIRYYPTEQQEDDTWKPSSCAITVDVPFCAQNMYTIAGLDTRLGINYYEIEMRAHTVSGFGEAYTTKVYVS